MNLLTLAVEETVSFHIGQWVGVILFSIPAAAALKLAVQSKPKSLRYAYLSAFLGLLVLCQIEIPLGLKEAGRGMTMILGILRSLTATAGVLCFLRALSLRRKDHAVGWLGPSAGALLCVFHGLYGVSLLLLPTMVRAGTHGESWTHRSEADGYTVTLPSASWVPGRMEGASSAFRCKILPVQVSIFSRREPLEEHQARVRSFQTKELTTLQDSRTETGKTPAGHDYFLAQGFDKQPSREIWVTICHLYRPEWGQTVTFISEAIPSLKSEFGHATQLSAIQDALRSIILSLR